MLNHYHGILGLVTLSGLATLLPGAYAADSLPPYAIVDTGQAKCYNASVEVACPATGTAFYGQDAQFTDHASHYTIGANGATVYDNVSGLTWQSSPETNGDGALSKADKMTYAKALAYCTAQGVASAQGFNDWRLPTIKELYSLIDFRGTDPSGYSGTDTSALTPFIDKTYFNFAYGDTHAGERIIDSQYASSTVYVAHPVSSGNAKLFGVNFADGRIKGYDLVMPGGNVEKTFFVQCVRGNPDYGVNTFVDHGDQTITDSATGLMWATFDSGVAMNWQNALAWVQTQNATNHLGYNDWRMPNAKELQSILDYSRSPTTTQSAAINPIFNATAFTNEGGQIDWPWYWASTTHAASNSMGASGVYLAFGRATGWQKATPTAICYTLYDVHGAGAQRSDPKISNGLVRMGTACNGGTAYGLGPQGDVQRTANFVRLVRGEAPKTDIFNLSISKVGNGTVTSSPSGIDCGATCSASFSSDATVTLTATPATGTHFTGWGGDCTGTGTCTVSMTAAKTISATFTAGATTFNLSVGKVGIGTVTSSPAGIDCGNDCNENYAGDTKVTLTATPANGFIFIGWRGACVNSTGTCTVSMSVDKTVTATFTLPVLTVRKVGNGLIVNRPAGIFCGTDCTELYSLNAVATLIAIPGIGSSFSNWTDCTSNSNFPQLCTITMNQSRTATATFK